VSDELEELMKQELEGTVNFYPVTVYQSRQLGLTILSRDNGKHWELINQINLGEGHLDTPLRLETDNNIPKRLMQDILDTKTHKLFHKIINVNLEQTLEPIPEVKTIPVKTPKLPSLTTCLSCGFKHMDNDKECPICHLTPEQALEKITKEKKKEKHTLGALGRLLHKNSEKT
jgi:hypothetical protein